MNELIAQLYDRAIVLEDGGDYVAGELDPVKFAQLIVRDVLEIIKNNTPKPDPFADDARYDAQEYGECLTNDICDEIKYLFGVEE